MKVKCKFCQRTFNDSVFRLHVMATHFEKEVWNIHSVDNMTEPEFFSKYASKRRRSKDGGSALPVVSTNDSVGGI